VLAAEPEPSLLVLEMGDALGGPDRELCAIADPDAVIINQRRR